MNNLADEIYDTLNASQRADFTFTVFTLLNKDLPKNSFTNIFTMYKRAELDHHLPQDIRIPLKEGEERIKIEFRRIAPVNSDLVRYRYIDNNSNSSYYFTNASSVLTVCKRALEVISQYEAEKSISMLGTNYFREMTFLNRDVPKAPIIYHTNNQQSKVWRNYILNLNL